MGQEVTGKGEAEELAIFTRIIGVQSGRSIRIDGMALKHGRSQG